MRPEDPALRVRGLGVALGGRPVLRRLGFVIPRGGVTGLLGPSGCGKTTLMRWVVGVQDWSTGSVEVLGMPAGDPRLGRRVEYTTQAASVYEDLTVSQNARYFAALHGVSWRAAGRALDQVALHALVDRRVDTLSGGERARVSLACALLAGPDLLILDEPTVGLDPVLRDDLWDLFHALAADGTTVFVSSHSMDEAARCDRLLMLRAGRLVADDSPGALRQATGARDLQDAFLRLVRSRTDARASGR